MKTFNQMLAAFSISTKEMWREQGRRNEWTRKQLQEQDALIDDLRARVDALEKAQAHLWASVTAIAVNLADSVSEVGGK